MKKHRSPSPIVYIHYLEKVRLNIKCMYDNYNTILGVIYKKTVFFLKEIRLAFREKE